VKIVQKDNKNSSVKPSMVIALVQLKPNLVKISSKLSKTISYTKIPTVMVLSIKKMKLMPNGMKKCSLCVIMSTLMVLLILVNSKFV
jgi:hypothetical protein